LEVRFAAGFLKGLYDKVIVHCSLGQVNGRVEF
jgi:hypothetical protein